MDIVKLLADARGDGVKIEAIEGELQIEAVASKKHWLDKLRPHKAALLDILQGLGTPIDEDAELESSVSLTAYQDFPIHTLPVPVGDYVRAASKAIGCDPSFIALPLLASLARAVGNKRVIRLKRTWTEPAIIWAAIVGNSGTHKTPAMQAATKFLDAKQKSRLPHTWNRFPTSRLSRRNMSVILLTGNDSRKRRSRHLGSQKNPPATVSRRPTPPSKHLQHYFPCSSMACW